MSERDGRHNKRHFVNLNKDKKDVFQTRSSRQTIILAKPPTQSDRDSHDKTKREKSAEKPTISILRTTPSTPVEIRGGAISPNLRSIADPQPTALYQLAAKHAGGDNVNPLTPPIEMKSSIKLLDESLQMCDVALEYLLDQNDFMVIGCLGLQGVGKSTLMSLLAGNTVDEVLTNQSPLIFKPQTMEQLESGTHCTFGVDLYVNANRTFFLDCQPLLSPSVMDRYESKKFQVVADPTSSENAMEIQSLQLAAFLMSICHVVIVAQDWFFDPNLVRFIQSAEMLKPSTPITSNQDEQLVDYYPHVLFLHNKATMSDFTNAAIIEETYKMIFQPNSKLVTSSGMGGSAGINVFLLGEIVSGESSHFQGHPGTKQLVAKLKEQLLGVDKTPLTHTVLSERNWFHYSAKVWESVTKKSSFFMEYSRLLP